MKWNAKYTKVDYANGTTRLKRVFAFWPTYINGKIVWFESYEVLQAYIIAKTIVVMDATKPGEGTEFLNGSWVDLSKRIIE